MHEFELCLELPCWFISCPLSNNTLEGAEAKSVYSEIEDALLEIQKIFD